MAVSRSTTSPEDPWNPKFLGQFEVKTVRACTGALPDGGRYAYIMAVKEIIWDILRIIDREELTHPVEVGSWWADGQYLGNKKASDIPEFEPSRS